MGNVGYVGIVSISREHHECQHDAEEENGIEEEASGCRASSRSCQETKEFVEDLVGFGVGAEEKY